jgi:hypothetical protein
MNLITLPRKQSTTPTQLKYTTQQFKYSQSILQTFLVIHFLLLLLFVQLFKISSMNFFNSIH